MSVDIDQPPIYDAIIKNKPDYLNDVWVSWFSTFVQTLIEYLSQNGIFVPRLTTSQRNQIQTPQEGQLIYTTDIIGPPTRTGGLQVWQVKANVGAWRTITTTP